MHSSCVLQQPSLDGLAYALHREKILHPFRLSLHAQEERGLLLVELVKDLMYQCTRRSYINNNSRKENNTGVKSKETKGTCDAFIMVDDQICQVKESTCPLDITQDILTPAVAEVTEEYGRVNLSALGRRLPLTREQLKRLKRNGFIIKPNGNLGKHREKTKLSGFEEIIDSYLRKGITNSQVIFDSIKRQGFSGGLTIVKGYIKAHEDLVPAPRILAIESPNRGRRYETGPGEMFQMDRGFVRVEDEFGQSWQCACFAMVCHHCGLRYIEFFPSARQENLFIGMLHAFIAMGVPKSVLTDNMKSVVVKRLCDGSPVWNKEYDAFQKLVGIQTKLCKVAHPFSKGKVERLVGYVKGNFLQGRRFLNITELNREALNWCREKNGLVTRTKGPCPSGCPLPSGKAGKASRGTDHHSIPISSEEDIV